jgi:beta-glucosidase
MAFGHYAETVVKRLSDRVKHWFTVNEIPCFIGKGYGDGDFAPGRTVDGKSLNQAYHHALLAHGLGVQAVRNHGGPGAAVGLVHNHLPAPPIPVIETDDHIAAAGEVYERENRHLMAPLFHGRYADAFLDEELDDAPDVAEGDLALIAQPMDFLGLNLYAGRFVRCDPDGYPEVLDFPAQYPQGDLPWLQVTPQVVYWAVRFATEVFGARTIYITENGAAYSDEPSNGEVLDIDRREYLRNHLISLHRATAEGYDVRGYFTWSLLDNFEWAEGYSKRFGLVRVDYETQQRTTKLSGEWYSAVIRRNGVV